MSNHKLFESLLATYGGSIAELSRQSGLNRRSIELKRDGKTVVRKWDVWALSYAIHNKIGFVTRSDDASNAE